MAVLILFTELLDMYASYPILSMCSDVGWIHASSPEFDFDCVEENINVWGKRVR